MTLFWILVLLVGVFFAYVRLAPKDAERWHVAPAVTQDKDFAGGVKRLVTTGPDGLSRLHDIAMATPRTTLLAGGPSEGMATYVTRTKIVGFPDYTTVKQTDDALEIHARLRFGRSDMGVNRARVEKWIAALQK